MILQGRSRDLGLLRTWIDARAPSFIRVSGPSGAGVTALVQEATRGYRVVYQRCPPLPDPSQRAALAAALSRSPFTSGTSAPADGSETPGWAELLQAVAEVDDGATPVVLILDDAHRLTEARSRLSSAFSIICASRTDNEPPFHLVLAGRRGALPEPPEPPVTVLDLALGPLPFRAARPFLPGALPQEKLESYAVFGGMPGALRTLDPDATLGTNIRRHFFGEGCAFGRLGTAVLEREVQTPSRYAAILSTLAVGEAGWGDVHAGVTDLTTSGQVAPYIKRLEELGIVEVRRSLDAKPKSRNRRYRIIDPLLSFWYRLALLTDWRVGTPDAPEARALRELVHAQAAAVFPEVCRQYMSHDAMELLAHNARECGSLWGGHPDVDVAGILRSGAAFYGVARWSDPPSPKELRLLDHAVRETRYGFGREARLRLLFAPDPPTPELTRAAARRHDTMLIAAADLAGEG